VVEKILLLETSGGVGQVGVASGEILLRVRQLDETRRHARDLAPAVAELLKAESWVPGDVELVIVSAGPGSYTGLRVGIMAAKVFIYATKAALVAVETFTVIAAQACAEVSKLDVIADAQQHKVYVQGFERRDAGATPEPAGALTIQPFADWVRQRDPQAWVSGPGLRQHLAKLPSGSRVVAADDWDPRAADLLRIGLRRFREGRRDDAWTVEPLYLRPCAAEEKWQSRSR
jgi:tRNA threonylcarbamoyladenosine biosynthesis protein TsaB